MTSSRTNTSEKAFRELSRVHAANLTAYATARLKLQQPDRLSPRDRAHLAAADAVLEEIRGLLERQKKREPRRAVAEREA
jgi:hypothetical protein